MSAGGRRLTLSPLGFDIVLALSQAPEGLRLADIGRIIGSPVSSVQTALRVLIANHLVERAEVVPPRYGLSIEHPARDELASLATVLPDPAHAIRVIATSGPCATIRGMNVDLRRSGPAAAAGAIAAGASIGLSELIAGLVPGAPSLLVSVGQTVIDLQPPGAKDVVVGLFGENDKLALEVFLVVVAAVLAAALGVLAVRSFRGAAAGFVVAGVAGAPVRPPRP